MTTTTQITAAEREALQASSVHASHRMTIQWAPGLARVAHRSDSGPEDWAVTVRVRETVHLTPDAVASDLATRVRMAMLRGEPTERQDVRVMLDELARTHLTGGYMLEIVEYGRVIHYRMSEGVYGYQEGDLLISDTGERSRVVRTGAGLQLEPDASI